MYFRPAFLLLFLALLFTAGSGCQKIESVASHAPPTVLATDTAADVHWLGKKHIGIMASAYYFTRIWQMPPSAQLERRTLYKLAAMPWQWLPGGTNLNAETASKLLLMLNDLVQEECYLEIRQPTNAAGETVFAIRLNESQADEWLTNLPAILLPLTGARAVDNPIDPGWSLRTTNVLGFVQLIRAGEWTIVSAGPETNPLLGEVAARIKRDGVPFISAGTNLWLETSLDFPRLTRIFPTINHRLPSSILHHPSSASRLDFTVSGDGGNVLTHAKITFAQPFSTAPEPWRLPVDLLHDPLTAFTAVRGLQPSLADWGPWRDLQMGVTPDQLFVWSLAGSPYQLYLAAPLPDARAQVATLTDFLLQKGNPWLTANGYINFDRAAGGNGVTWGNLADIKPFIKSAGSTADGWLFAGLFPETNAVALAPPADLLNDVLRRTNLVYYDWEVTGPRLSPVLSLARTVRLVTQQPDLPADAASLNCLSALVQRLGTSATIATRTGPAELSILRRSTIGFTAPELHLIASWLESTNFPKM